MTGVVAQNEKNSRERSKEGEKKSVLLSSKEERRSKNI